MRTYLPLFVLLALATPARALCPDVEELRAMGIELFRYRPDWAPARQDLQFVYTSGIVAKRGGDHAAVHAALDSLSHKLLVEQDNIYGAERSDLALLYDMFRVTDDFPYPYGDTYYREHGGGNFLLAGGEPANMNHIDIVLTTADEGALLASHRCSPRLPHKGEYGGIDGFPSDDGEPDRATANGIVVRGIPLDPGSAEYQSLLHELGHVIEFQDGVKQHSIDIEARAEVGRVILGNPPDPRPWRGYEVPYHGTFVLTRKRSSSGVDDDLGRSLRFMGQLWLAYLAEHYHHGTPTDIRDDLLHDYLTRPRDAWPRVDLSMHGMAQLLEQDKYDDDALYPRFASLDGESRLEVLFHDFGVALALDAPHLGDQWGFPLRYERTGHLPLFQDIGDSPNRAGIPPEFTIQAEDLGTVREIRGPIEYDDGSQLDFRMYSWCQEIVVLHVPDDVLRDGDREVLFRVVGHEPLHRDAEAPFSPLRPFQHSLSASAGWMGDLDGRPFWAASEKILGIEALSVTTQDGRTVVEGVLPPDARTAVVVMSLAERGMLNSMPRARRSIPWEFHIELELRERSL